MSINREKDLFGCRKRERESAREPVKETEEEGERGLSYTYTYVHK